RTEWASLVNELEGFGVGERERVFHLAYERRFRNQTLDALVLHNRGWKGPQARPRPRFQAFFCLDEREESMRRHVEELAPDAETFGTAGFYAVVMYYRGSADAHFVPLCPVVVRPQHWVGEEVCAGHEGAHERQTQVMRVIGAASHQIHVGSRTAAFGAVLAACFGPLASVPLVARILFPRWTARLTRLFGRFVRTPPATRLKLNRSAPEPGPENGRLGFTLDEMAAGAERLLRDVGCLGRLSRVVLLMGHGSSSLNNPHKSAYDCGACGGNVGGPNARAMATILNDPQVRERLARRGITIPADTVIVGGWHNTCNDVVTFLDLDRVPESHRGEVEAALRT
ncbi:MAG: putative inorganic carbon transporter subunit DabA, partial [Gemmataceae bacterium]